MTTMGAQQRNRRRTPRLPKGERQAHQFYLSPALEGLFLKRVRELGVSQSHLIVKLVEAELAERKLRPEDFDRNAPA